MPCQPHGIFLIVENPWYNVSMEIDMNENNWATPCPKYDCRKTACKCGLEYVSIPTSLGDDSEGSNVAPKNGAYCNALVFYEANSHVYIYTKEGIPTLIDVDASDISTLEQEVIKAQKDIHEFREDIDTLEYDMIGHYDTVTQMIQDTSLKNGKIVKCLGNSSTYDKRGGLFKISSSASSSYNVNLDNGLYANYIYAAPRNVLNEPRSKHVVVSSSGFFGDTKSASYQIDIDDSSDEAIKIQYNECEIGHLRIKNSNNYQNKIGINITSPSQRNRINSVYIGDSFATGIKMPTSHYSQFNDVWVTGCDIGVEIGRQNSPTSWTGVLDFDACHFNTSKLAIREYAKDTNTICIDKSSFEVNLKCIESDGLMYIRNTYFGDNPTGAGEEINVLTANPGSETHFTDCSVGFSATNHVDDGIREVTFKLKSSDGVGSKVFVSGGLINISNNNHSQGNASSIYSTDSSLNEIYLDNVKFIPSTANSNHNLFPYYLYEGYSPLRSLSPVQNYVVNGTMNDELANEFIPGSDSSHGSLDPNLTNPFGGRVVTFSGDSTSGRRGYSTFYFKIPKRLVGKQMVLEVNGLSSTSEFDFYSSNFDGANIYNTYLTDSYTTDKNRVKIRRTIVTPTSENGKIQFFIHQNETDLNAWYRLSGVILKEIEYKDILSCYKDQDIRMSSTIPTTSNATQGDIVYAYQDGNATCQGWLYDGTNWQVFNNY